MRTSKSKKLAKRKADKYFSLYIRKKHADHRGAAQCATCGKWQSVNNLHCGHFMSRRYESTRYDEKNCAVQCAGCNTFNQGRQFKFGMWIDQQYGEGTAEQLEIKSKMKSHRKQSDYEYIAKEYCEKIKEMESVFN